MPVSKKKPTTLASEGSTRESSSPNLPEQEEFRQSIRRLAVSAVQVLIEQVMCEELEQCIGASWGECTPTRRGYRNGSYTRDLKKQHDVIEREVPAIVSAEIWDRAQVVLHEHVLFSPRNARRSYLLRGIIKCSLCGLTYVGIGMHMYLRGDEADQLRAEIARLHQRLQVKNREKDAVITLFRRGRINERSLDAQLDQIQQEEKDLQHQIEHLHGLLQNAHSLEAALHSTKELLQTLRLRLEEPLTWEIKRHLIEALIERILVNTIDTEQDKKEASITVIYRFGASLTF